MNSFNLYFKQNNEIELIGKKTDQLQVLNEVFPKNDFSIRNAFSP